MPRRGSPAIDEVDSLLRGGEQRAQIFTYELVKAFLATDYIDVILVVRQAGTSLPYLVQVLVF